MCVRACTCVCVYVYTNDRARESSEEPGQEMRPGPWREGPSEALPYSVADEARMVWRRQQ